MNKCQEMRKKLRSRGTNPSLPPPGPHTPAPRPQQGAARAHPGAGAAGAGPRGEAVRPAERHDALHAAAPDASGAKGTGSVTGPSLESLLLLFFVSCRRLLLFFFIYMSKSLKLLFCCSTCPLKSLAAYPRS